MEADKYIKKLRSEHDAHREQIARWLNLSGIRKKNGKLWNSQNVSARLSVMGIGRRVRVASDTMPPPLGKEENCVVHLPSKQVAKTNTMTPEFARVTLKIIGISELTDKEKARVLTCYLDRFCND